MGAHLIELRFGSFFQLPNILHIHVAPLEVGTEELTVEISKQSLLHLGSILVDKVSLG